MTKETTQGMRKAVNWLASLERQRPTFDPNKGVSATDLIESESVQAVAVALGRDPLEIAFRVANAMNAEALNQKKGQK